MTDGNRSFWSSVPGLVTGLAGLLTGIVGLFTVLIQLNVIGGKDSNHSSTVAATGTTVTTALGSTTSVFGATTTTGLAQVGTFTVVPTALDFQPSDPRDKMVTVRNTGATTLNVLSPTVVGPDKDRFLPSLNDCAAPLRPNLSCTIRLTFAPAGALKRYAATLQVTTDGATRGQEVALTATTLL